MESMERKRARAFVVVGFVLIAVGSVINVFRLVTWVDYFSIASSRAQFELFLSPLVGVVTVWSWWWLSKIRVANGEQTSFVRKGFYGLALQNALSTALVLAGLFDLPAFDRVSWNVAPIWAEFLGSLVLSIGFILLGQEFTIDVDDSDDASEAQVDIVD